MKEPYEKRFPIGIQTIVKDTRGAKLTYQVNTRTIEGWWLSKYTAPSDVKRELLAQAKRFEATYQAEVDTRYVKQHLR